MEAGELFGICRELVQAGPSTQGTRQMHEVIALCAAEGCKQHRGTFGNLFSQVDFLCKQLGLKADQKRAIQTARRHSNTSQPIEGDDWLYDLRAVTLFISAVFSVDVPGSLLQVLPVNLKPQPKGLSINREYVRCIVRSFDAQTIQAETEDGEIIVDYGNTDEGRDFGYLQKILREGMQLNLLDNHVSDHSSLITHHSSLITSPSSLITHHSSLITSPSSLITPGLIVVEPDFLIDISSLAACFTAYGHHPLLYTVNRLKPKPNTQATLLGNFAGAALDDVINNPQNTTAHTLRRSFREQALRFCACDDFNAEDFKQAAERQMRNIREAVEALTHHSSLITSHSSLPSFLLEPSFVCEKLGLQGRVDLMTSDMRLLVEQKSGKNMKIEHQSHDPHGVQREDHYVQLLLYYGILRYGFGKSASQVDTRLLYSRYEVARGLVSVNYYRTLFREAIQLRNQVVALDLLVAREGFGRIVPLLCADTIYKGIARDGFFHRYVQPEIDALHSSLFTLHSLERAYYERMMTFVYREQRAAKLGNSEQTLHHSGGCASDLWLMPLSEKVEQGIILPALRITDRQRSSAYGGYDLITLQGECENSNFRRGDMVYLYRYREQPDVRSSILYKGTLQEIGTTGLVVRLNDGQQNADCFQPSAEDLWAVEHGGSDTSTNSQIRSLHQFIQSPQERKDLLLGQRQPQADTTLTLSRAYNPHYDDILLRIKQARDYFLLVGPPGTGKTSMALRFMVEEELSSIFNLQSSILLAAYTNRAVDEICAMLCDAHQDFLRLGNESSCDPRFKDYLLESRLGENAQLQAIRSLIRETPIIVSTTSMLQAHPFIFRVKHFSLAIVDEASQILEPGLIGLLSSEQIDRFVLIGDHKQLPAVVQQDEADAHVSEPLLQAIGLTDCRQSLFQRLYRWEVSQGRTQFIGTLDHQGRMHPDVARFANEHFYGSRLQIVPRDHQLETRLHYDAEPADALDRLLMSRRMLFLPVSPSSLIPHHSSLLTHHSSLLTHHSSLLTHHFSAKSNPDEARLVADIVRRIQRFYGDRFDPATTVGIIVPYRNQIAAIESELLILNSKFSILNSPSISIDTVERYQGSQRDVIIYSFTVSRLYQLDFLTANTFTDEGQTVDRKLNVALTRARCQTIMVGNPDILRHNPLFRQLVDNFYAKI